MPQPKFNLRATAGMSFSGECRWHFWLGWLSLTAGTWAVVYALYTAYRSFPPAVYLLHLYLAFAAPFLALAFTDLRVVSIYYQTYAGLSHGNLAQIILDPAPLERIRHELRLIPVLRWARPPHSRGVREQLMSASLWWPAVTRPQDAAWTARYGEWLVDTLLGYLALGLGAGWWLLWLYGLSDLTGEVPALATGLTGLGLLVIGYSSIRLSGRRQAILDFFTTWLVPRDTTADPPPNPRGC